MNTTTGSLIIGYDFSKKVNEKGDIVDSEVLIVGTEPKGMAIDIINAFVGPEAREMFKKLTTRPRPAGDPHVD